MVTTQSKRLTGGFSEAILTATDPASTPAPISMRHGYRELLFNGITTNDIRVGLVPAIKQVWLFDASAKNGAGSWTNLLNSKKNYSLVNRGETAGNGDYILGGIAAGDFLYVGSVGKLGGHRFIQGQVNATDAGLGMAATRSNGNNFDTLALAAIGTESTAGIHFEQTGNVTFTAPTTWTASALNTMVGLTSTPPDPYNQENLYWVRYSFSGAIDAATSIIGIIPMPVAEDSVSTKATESIYMILGAEYTLPLHSPWVVGALDVQSDTDAATATYRLTWLRR